MPLLHDAMHFVAAHPPCDISSFGAFLPGPWTITRSSLCRLRGVVVARSAVGPVRIAWFVWGVGTVLSCGAVAGAAGLVLRWFPSGALDSHPVFPPQTAPGRHCLLGHEAGLRCPVCV